jgi:hypothetical protein
MTTTTHATYYDKADEKQCTATLPPAILFQQLSLIKSKSVEEIDQQTATKTTITTTYHKPNGSASTTT